MPYLVKIHMRYGSPIETICRDEAQVDAFLGMVRQAWDMPLDSRLGHFTFAGPRGSSKVCLNVAAIEAIVITEVVA